MSFPMMPRAIRATRWSTSTWPGLGEGLDRFYRRVRVQGLTLSLIKRTVLQLGLHDRQAHQVNKPELALNAERSRIEYLLNTGPQATQARVKGNPAGPLADLGNDILFKYALCPPRVHRPHAPLPDVGTV